MLFSSELSRTALTTSTVHKVSGMKRVCKEDGITVGVVIAGKASVLEPDIAALRAAVLKEVEEGPDAVVVGHSWSGIIVTGAMSGLGKRARKNEGEKGGVIRLAFMCAFVPPEHTSLVQALGGQEPEWYMCV